MLQSGQQLRLEFPSGQYITSTKGWCRDGKLLTPLKRYSTSRVRINPDSFDREVICRVVHGFYEWNEYPTLCAVLEKVKEG